MRVLSLALFIWIVIGHDSNAQESARIRTRAIDYSEYDKQTASLPYAQDKIRSAAKLIEITDSIFTPEDEEYFTARKSAAIYYELAGDFFKASELIQEAIVAYEKNFPFYNRGYASVTPDYLAGVYLDLSRLQRSQKLFEKNIRYLESRRSMLESSPAYYIRQQFYSELGNSLLGAEQYPEAIKAGLQLKELTESGALKMTMQSADEVFKINDDYPKEVKEQMLKAKADYEKSMRSSQESVLSGQRLSYNLILAQAYFKQYQFEEAIPYSKAMVDEQRKMMEYSAAAMEASQLQFGNNSQLPDSVKRQIQDGIEYLKHVNEIGGTSIQLVIAAYKANQKVMASQYASGKFEKAVLFQLKNQFNESEEAYQSGFESIRKLSGYKFLGPAAENYRKAFLPFYLNLQVNSAKLEIAYNESKKLILEEENALKNNFQFFSESEKKEFFKSYTQMLNQYFSLLLYITETGDDRAGEILDKILQTKGVILDATRDQEKQLKKMNDRVALAQLAEIRRLRDKLASFYQLSLKNPVPSLLDSINRTSIRINDLERTVNKKLGTTNLLKPIRWQQIQATLKKGEIYLEILRLPRDYFTFDKPKIQYWGFAIKPEDAKPVLFPIGEGESFEGRGLRNYQNRIRAQLDDAESFKLYWANIEAQTKGVSTIYLSTDGVYHSMNPLTLKSPTSGKYLLDEIVLRPVSTGRDLLMEVIATKPSQNFALVGNPIFEMNRKEGSNLYLGNEVNPIESDEGIRSGVARLPGTQREIDLIQEMARIKGVNVQVFSEAEANESKVKGLKSPDVLHLATHGEFDQLSRVDTYLKSKLILAGAADKEPFSIEDYSKYEDGFLSAYEVTQLELPGTRLVVLSACETGLGETQSGEGVWGLQRAFQLAGARSVMGSLWKISDEATVTFMETFYKSYLAQPDIYIAYRSAMQATRSEYSHPYYWGAFTIVGGIK
jgi:CHAT domain-containing protein